MPSRRRVFHPQETYRFSMSRTLSDYPLLIGEILRRDNIRAVRRAKRRSFLFDLRRVFGMRMPRAVGVRKNSLLAQLSWQLNNRDQGQLPISLSSSQGQNGTIR
ncbi:MAG: hypothetical protein JO025_20760 [Verrucomicrobia bacterium]|nr:hypothetical protein [Verrucomicrobiota bacterium]